MTLKSSHFFFFLPKCTYFVFGTFFFLFFRVRPNPGLFRSSWSCCHSNRSVSSRGLFHVNRIRLWIYKQSRYCLTQMPHKSYEQSVEPRTVIIEYYNNNYKCTNDGIYRIYKYLKFQNTEFV